MIMPAYNEQDNIKRTVKEWYPVVQKTGPDSRLVVVNDGSRDATGDILRELGEQYPQLIPISKENEGHGAALLYGYQFAIQRGADFIFQTDSDGQTLPEEFWPLWGERQKCGLLIGDRTHRQDGFFRIIVTGVLRLLLLAIFGVWVKDPNTPFRLMRAEELKEMLYLIPPKYGLSNVIISVLYTKKGEAIYFPITFRPRQAGTNSINLKKIFGIGGRSLRDFVKIKRSMRNVEWR